MPFLLAEILNFQGSTHRIGVGSFSYLVSAGSFYSSHDHDERHVCIPLFFALIVLVEPAIIFFIDKPYHFIPFFG